jgi:uncharacterized NAD-dependent epimerase/dehydratase family protein
MDPFDNVMRLDSTPSRTEANALIVAIQDAHEAGVGVEFVEEVIASIREGVDVVNAIWAAKLELDL